MSNEATKESSTALGPQRLKVANQVRNHWCVTVPHGTTKADILRPSFWTHHAARLRTWEHIEIQTEDGTWYAEVLVKSTDRSWIRVHLLTYHSLTTKEVSETQASDEDVVAVMAQYEVKHRGPRLWSVIRLSDAAIMIEDIKQKDDALAEVRRIAVAEVAHQTIEA